MKKILITILFPIHFFSFYVLFYNQPINKQKNTSKSEKKVNNFLVNGIDVSHHQGSINWSKVKQDSVAFCFIKSTEGSSFLDKNYKKNVKECRQNNILTGVYHFYKGRSNPKKQFENLKKNVNPNDLDFPPVIDLEYHTNEYLKHPKHKRKFITDLKVFEKLVRDYYGVSPIFYTNPPFYNNLLKDDFENNLWICDLSGKSISNIDSTKLLFWQHSFNGKINGINGDVDLNVFKGNIKKLNQIVINKNN
jgi:lysozyme